MGYAGKWEVVIDTKASQADGRKPLMPYQQEAIDRLNAFFDLTGKVAFLIVKHHAHKIVA